MPKLANRAAASLALALSLSLCAAAHAQEQREPQLHLGMLQDFAHRRLRDMQQLGGSADGAGLANSLEYFDVAQAHGGSP